MSTRKDVARTSTNSKKTPSTTTKTSTREREGSKDRKKKMDMQSSEKIKVKPVTNNKTRISDKIHKSSDSKSMLDPKSMINKKTNSKPEVPVMPSSSRVSTSQFFPSKHMYSNALKSKDGPIKKQPEESSSKIQTLKIIKTKPTSDKKLEKSTGRLVKPIHTNVINQSNSDQVKDEQLSLEEIKSMYSSPDTSTISERPRTATLRKGSIVNANIVGPEVPKIQVKMKAKESVPKVKTPSPKSDNSEEGKYEDDFESYESDFEEYSSNSSTENFDNVSIDEGSSSSSSINTSSEEMKTKEQNSTQKRISSTSSEEERKLDSGHFDMSDYKHRQILDNIKESIEKENTTLVIVNNPASLSDEGFEEQKSLQFINFLDAKKKYERRKSMKSKRKRGKEILSMIRLDSLSFTLFDLAPVSYETYIKNFGKGNAIQTACQTGDDDIDEEIQTDDICYSTKWTQQPSAFTNFDQEVPNFWQNYKNEFLGVGSDNISAENTEKKNYNEYSLNKFILSAGELILRIQEESITNEYSSIQENKKTSSFSDGYCQFNTSKDIFVDSKVSYVSFSCDISNRFITVHRKYHSSIVSVWNISNTDEPEGIFSSYGIVNCCSFGIGKSDLAFMGLEDGSILIWDIRRQLFNKSEQITTVPLFSTDINSGHQTKVVAIHHLDISSEENSNTHQTNEICSLDEEGEIIVWTIIQKRKEQHTFDIDIDVVLVKNTSISLKRLHPQLIDLQCTDFVTSYLNTNYLFISTNYGFIIHHLIKGGRSSVKKFLPGTQSIARCLESCPFSSEYFLAGYDNGNINLYSRSSEKPLMILSDKENSIEYCPIDQIRWSKNKPVVIYTKDAKNRLNIWYLNESDMFPIYSIPFEEEITCINLSPISQEIETKKSYMVIGTVTGSLYLYQLNEEHGRQPRDLYEESIKTFLNYVNRL